MPGLSVRNLFRSRSLVLHLLCGRQVCFRNGQHFLHKLPGRPVCFRNGKHFLHLLCIGDLRLRHGQHFLHKVFGRNHGKRCRIRILHSLPEWSDFSRRRVKLLCNQLFGYHRGKRNLHFLQLHNNVYGRVMQYGLL